MGELRDVIHGRAVGVAITAAVVLATSGCAPRPATPPPGSAGPSPTVDTTVAASPAASPSSGPVLASEGRLIWLVDAAGTAGLWTTDLAGEGSVVYLPRIAEATTSVRDAFLVGDAMVVIVDRPGASELTLVRPEVPPRVLLDRVSQVLPDTSESVLAVRDAGAGRQVVRVPLAGGRPAVLWEAALPADASVASAPFGVALSPDRRTVAAGWVGGRVTIVGPLPSTIDDVGAPLIVGDDGRLAATIGRAGEAYRIDGDAVTDLAPPDSDPLALAGTGFVAWPVLDADGALTAVQLEDVLTGASRTFPAQGPAGTLREFLPDHVLLEATAFDPRRRTIGYLELGDGRFGSFEAKAPAAPR
ncbi:MAG TPA: hypothetical protein VFI69_03700 [Candidatus Limnocylindrales bacterium]|nr:hypothetical protein [Candidatus Limnocylindrales bacterium]